MGKNIGLLTGGIFTPLQDFQGETQKDGKNTRKGPKAVRHSKWRVDYMDTLSSDQYKARIFRTAALWCAQAYLGQKLVTTEHNLMKRRRTTK